MTMNHREIEANGISLHFVEEGQGSAVVFCHGFPAIWSSWKAQMEAVASAGFMAIASTCVVTDEVLHLWTQKPIRRTRRLETSWRYSMRLALRLRPSLATISVPALHERCDDAS
jgi:hypothetical protein